MGKKLLGRFTKKNCKKNKQTAFKIEKTIKKEGNKLYLK